MTPRTAAEAKSLDVVQRVLVSLLLATVMGLISGMLALYLVLYGDKEPGNVVGLWVMTGVIGLITAEAILLINRRRPYHPAVILGLLPMAASCYWIFH